jgi:hypothetical protein
VRGTVDRVDFNRRDNIESGLLEPEAHTADARKQVNSDRTKVRRPLAAWRSCHREILAIFLPEVDREYLVPKN